VNPPRTAMPTLDLTYDHSWRLTPADTTWSTILNAHALPIHSEARLPNSALHRLFQEARTFSAWRPDPVSEKLLHEIYELARLGPTSANSSPARFVFLTSDEAKARLEPALMPGNRNRNAPVVVLIAWDTGFHEHLPTLFPGRDLRPMFAGNQPLIDETAFRNSSLQGAYLMLAARSLGLDCGPMSGFDAAKVNDEFFPDGRWKINFICAIGYGDRGALRSRAPRLEFQTACRII
jgi:3-hydroxypropanoate dehydrogenase